MASGKRRMEKLKDLNTNGAIPSGYFPPSDRFPGIEILAFFDSKMCLNSFCNSFMRHAFGIWQFYCHVQRLALLGLPPGLAEARSARKSVLLKY
jgi:hypothetical protein